MFETLSEKLTEVFQHLGNKGTLSEKDVDAALRQIRLALLEADVNFNVARDLVAKIRSRSLQDEVLKSLRPDQQVIKITNEEITGILSGGTHTLEPGPNRPAVIMMIGLNGSGKTTTAAKLARHLKQTGHLPFLIAADLARPAAIEQLETLGKQIDVAVYQDRSGKSTSQVVKDGLNHAASLGATWAIVDTAGRFQIDKDLMADLADIKNASSPSEVLLVVDAMTGQEAVEIAKDFNDAIGLTGLIISKMDGDARGGAALSITSISGVPIKFMGVGERTNELEQFYPDRLSSRILGMGDVLSLIEKTQTVYDENQALEIEKKLRQATFNLEDFLRQLHQLRKMGPLTELMDMIPGMSALKGKVGSEALDETQLNKIQSMIYSMTLTERRNPSIIGGSRRKRIAKGSGTTAQDINQLLNQFRQSQKIMKQMSSGGGMKSITQLLK